MQSSLESMYTKDSLENCGFLDEERTFVNWKDPLREISCSRKNVEDRMMAVCAIAELGGGSDSAYRERNYGERNYDENVSNSEVEFSDRHRRLNGDERLEFVGGWMNSQERGKIVTRYVHAQNDVTPGFVNIHEASRGRKRKMEEPAEGTRFMEKCSRVADARDKRCYRKTVKMADEDYHTTTVQSPESLHNDQSAGYSPTIAPSDSGLSKSCNKEVSGRFDRSAMISSHIPSRVEAHTEVEKAGGRFVRTSMRGSFPMNENKQTSDPVQWSTNSSDSTNCGSLVGLRNIPAEMLKLPRNAVVPFGPDSADVAVSVYNGSLQSSETVKNNQEAASVKSPPVLSEVSVEIGQSSSSRNDAETSISDVVLRNSVIPQHPLLVKRVDEELLRSPASEFRQTTPPSHNRISHMLYVTNPENGLTQISFLSPSDFRVPDLHKSVYGCNTGLPTTEPRSPWSEERKSAERLWSNLEASCERELDASKRRKEVFGISQYDPFLNNHPAGCADYTLKPVPFHPGNIYSGYNVQVQSPEYFTVAIPFERIAVQSEMPQLGRNAAQAGEPNTGASYKNPSVQNEVSQRREMPIEDQPNEHNQLIGVGMSPALRTREINTRWIAWQRDNEQKPFYRSKSLSPSVKSNVESGNFGSLQSIRAYYKTLGKTKPSWRLETGTAREVECSRDSQQVVESKAAGTDMPIDLSSRVRKREQNVLESVANANKPPAYRNIDCCGRRNTEISGGNMPQTGHTRSPVPGTILLTPKGVLSDRSGVDVSESLLQVPSPSISQPSSRLSSPASMPDSHLPPKKRRMTNYFSPIVDSSSAGKEVPNVSTSPDVEKSPAWNHIPVSVEESLELETKAQLEEKTGG